MELEPRVKELADQMGVDYLGVADLFPAREAILEQGGQLIASYPRAISVGIALLQTIVDELPGRAERAVAISYRHHAYEVVNQRLDMIASCLGSLLQKAGHRALPISATKQVDDERLCASFSHKLAAHLAGLGWIGKSCMLVTPTRGPRVRWTTVLTDAPLRITGSPTEERCEDCVQCVEICPVRAFTGEAFREGEPREARYDAAKCKRYFSQLKQKDPDAAVCGMCLYVCPYGRQ